MKALNAYDYTVVAIYMVMMVAIGVYFIRYISDSSDYFRAGNKLSWWIAGLSAFMSSFSAYMFTGGAGVIYQEGLTGTFILSLTGVAIFVGWLVFAKLWRRSRVTTILEFLDERFNRSAHQVASWTFIPFNVLYCATALYSLAIFIASALNMNIYSVIWISGLVIVIYTLLGGLWAVCVTDVVQFLVLLPVCLLLIPLSIMQITSFDSFFQAMPEGYFSLPSPQHPWYWLAALFVILLHGQNTNPLVQRYFSVRDEREARRVALMCSVLFIFGLVIWTVPPVVVRYLYPDIASVINLPNPQEGAYVVIALHVLPHGLIGLMISAIFAAAMSAIDSQYNVIAGVFTKDIVQKLYPRNLNEKALLLVGQISTLVLGLIVIWLSLVMARSGAGSFRTMMKLFSLTGTPIATPLLLGFLYRKAPPQSFLAAYVAGGGLALLFFFFPPAAIAMQNLGPAVEFTVTTFALFAAGLAAFFLSQFFFKASPRQQAKIDSFFRKIDMPVDVATEIVASKIDNAPLARFVGLMSIILGVVILPFALIPAPLADRMTNLGMGLALAGFGVGMVYFGKKKISGIRPDASA
ncbi:MAG TPA: sodium/solute symporter [Candidatus Glassbacteria bacterium]|nr:sodium/solute symporter [Candidatus Glassbacteria bacterium]